MQNHAKLNFISFLLQNIFPSDLILCHLSPTLYKYANTKSPNPGLSYFLLF